MISFRFFCLALLCTTLHAKRNPLPGQLDPLLESFVLFDVASTHPYANTKAQDRISCGSKQLKVVKYQDGLATDGLMGKTAKFITTAFSKPLVMDIGAAEGAHSACLASEGAYVIVAESHPATAHMALGTACLSGLGSRVTVFPAIIGGQEWARSNPNICVGTDRFHSPITDQEGDPCVLVATGTPEGLLKKAKEEGDFKDEVLSGDVKLLRIGHHDLSGAIESIANKAFQPCFVQFAIKSEMGSTPFKQLSEAGYCVVDAETFYESDGSPKSMFDRVKGKDCMTAPRGRVGFAFQKSPGAGCSL